MHHSDPMSYTMEQLIKALTAEALGEVSDENVMLQQVQYFNNSRDCEYLENNTKWEHIATALVKEIKNYFPGGEIRTSGPLAEECMDDLSSLVGLYSGHPMAEKLLNAVETLTSDDANSRAYTSLVSQAMNSEAADEWSRHKQYR